MSFDIVRGKIAKPEQSNQLIAAVKEYMEKILPMVPYI